MRRAEARPSKCRQLMLRAKRDGDLLLAMQADAHSRAKAVLLPGEAQAANTVATKRLASRFRVSS